MSHRFAVICGLSLAAQVAASQTPTTPPPPSPAPGFPTPTSYFPARFTGEMTLTEQLYGVNGIASRRPGESWQIGMNPNLLVFGEFNIGVSVLLSSEGSQFRQNIGQLGLNPRIGWATFHLGDFTDNYSTYTVQGTQVRGAGVDLRPGLLRISVQGGQSQRTVSGGLGDLAYKRNLFAASIGVGKEGASFVDVMVVKAKDDASSLPSLLADTLLLDTIPPALRPKVETRPEENLVVGTRGQLQLLANKVTVKAEAAGALTTGDQSSPAVNPGSVASGSLLNDLIPLRLSTSGDFAYHVQADANLGRASIRGGYEYVGAGYQSLGLSYLINDRRAIDLGGTLRLLQGQLTLQGQYQHQNDNLLHQKTATTDRDAVMGTASMLLGRTLTLSVTAMDNVIANDAAVDTFKIDNRSFALSTNASIQSRLFGRPSTISLSYALQHTADDNIVTQIPGVTVHNLATSVQIPITKALSLAPTASLAVIQNTGAPTQQNIYLGARAQYRTGSLRTSGGLTQTFSNGRHVFGLTAQADYPLFWDSRLSLQARHTRYGAIGNQPAFQESFFIMSLARSF
ncbi:MAG TPA: hypothetical protein VN674_01480 [Gemmatimonadales bacterium]|nr:hypothetical protein [Gemmatimonadales bacterium]